MSFESSTHPYNANDPNATFLSSSCLDFLLIELVPLANRVTHERDAALLEHTSLAGGDHHATGATAAATASAQDNPSVSQKAMSSTADASFGRTEGIEGEELDAVRFKLESQGHRVGQGLVERFSRDRPRFNDTLDVIKFLCKDLWSLVFGKNVDNLKTNHRGVYVLTDNVFRPFSRMSGEAGRSVDARAQQFLWFPCGVIRGALAALGIKATVQAEVDGIPRAVFQIKTTLSKS